MSDQSGLNGELNSFQSGGSYTTGDIGVPADIEESSYARLQRLSNMDHDEIRSTVAGIAKRETSRVSIAPLVCAICFCVIYLCPILPDNPTAHNCLAILVGASMCWATECIPSYATAYLVPAASIWLQIGYDKSTGERMATVDLATQLAFRFTEPIIFVFLGSLTMSAALSKLQITDRVSSWLLARIPPRVAVLLFAIMCLNFIMSSFLSNIASTTLILTFMLRIIRSIDPQDYSIKALLMGLAWSGNAGGIPTPIGSAQNIMATRYVSEGRDKPITFPLWMGFGFPTGFIILLTYYGFLWVMLKVKRARTDLPSLDSTEEFDRWTWKHTLTVLTVFTTILMWAIHGQFTKQFGHMGITSLIPVVTLFSVGVLDSKDFGTLRWSTLVLMGGGLALGESMTLSGLLDVVSEVITNGLSKLGNWTLLIILLSVTAVLTSLINHTSGAAILFPVIAAIGEARKCKILFLTCCCMMIAGSQLFHISPFPNALVSGVPKHWKSDPSRFSSESFLSGTDFMLLGFPTVIFVIGSVG
jgi:phosphate transporter